MTSSTVSYSSAVMLYVLVSPKTRNFNNMSNDQQMKNELILIYFFIFQIFSNIFKYFQYYNVLDFCVFCEIFSKIVNYILFWIFWIFIFWIHRMKSNKKIEIKSFFSIWFSIYLFWFVFSLFFFVFILRFLCEFFLLSMTLIS